MTIINLSKKARVALIILAVLSISSVVYLVIKTRNTSQTQTSLPLASPKIPNYLNQTLSIDLQINKSSFNFPAKLPVLEQQKLIPLSDSQSTSIANNLGFNFEPLKTQDTTDGTVEIWNGTDNFLVIRPKVRKIQFGPNYNPEDKIPNVINKQLTDQDMQSIANDFLVNKIGIQASSLKYSNTLYFHLEKGVERFTETKKANATVFQLNFTFSTSSYPILTLDPQGSVIFVQILKDGSILNSEVNLANNLVTGPTQYKLKDFTEFQKGINEAVLVGLNDGNVNLPGLTKNDIQNLSVTDVQLGYLLDDPNSEILQPVFILKGSANVVGYSNPVSADLYLPALSKNP